jgi:CRISPR-associated endonuclease/helicase Cas3
MDERRTGGWLDEVYASVWGRQWRHRVAQHRDMFSESFLRFAYPFDDREKLAEEFDQLFEGTEAVLEQDLRDYSDALNSASRRSGRLLGAEYLVPLPHYGRKLGRYNKELKIVVVDADYDPEHGLGTIHAPQGPRNLLGEVL